MRDRVKARLTYANVMASVAVFMALGGSAYAATGVAFVSHSGAINGCVPTHGGTLQVLRPGKKCPKGDTPLSFNARGPVGPGFFAQEGAHDLRRDARLRAKARAT